MPRITLSAVEKSYVSGQKAVDHLDLEIPDGAFMCLLGPSGCGKTTTLRMIAGLEQPTAGTIAVDDHVLDSVAQGVFVPTEKRRMGLVFQSYALWPHLTVEKNTDFGLRMQKVAPQERIRRTEEALAMLRIDDLKDRYPAQLSGGQQQRVALARMLAVNPSVLLLDEPLSNLDARLRLEMRAELKRIHETWRSTIVFVTHDQLEAMTLASHVAVMNEGVLQQVGSPMEIYDRPANRFVAEFVGNPPMNYVSRGEGDSPKLAASLIARIPRSWRLPAEVAAVGVRPEAIRLAPGDPRAIGGAIPEAAWRVPARIETVLPTGASWTVQVGAADGTLFLVTSEEVDLPPGTEVTCWAHAAALHLFGADHRRIEPDGAVAGATAGTARTVMRP